MGKKQKDTNIEAYRDRMVRFIRRIPLSMTAGSDFDRPFRLSASERSYPGQLIFMDLSRAEAEQAMHAMVDFFGLVVHEPDSPSEGAAKAAEKSNGPTIPDVMNAIAAGWSVPPEGHESPDRVTRVSTLREARDAITGSRPEEYGPAKAGFEKAARIITELIGTRVLATDIPLIMIAMKLSRLAENQKSHDSWVDVAGYAALGAEVVEQ